MPEVDLTAMPAVMEAAFDEAVMTKDRDVLAIGRSHGCPLLEAH